MKNKRSSKGIWLDVGIFVICLAVITSCISSGMFAKFTSKAGEGYDVARVASFTVNAKFNGDASGSLQDDAGAVYELVLENKSEVVVRCSLTLKFDPAAEGLAVTIGSVTQKVDDNGEVTFENLDSMSPGHSNGTTVEITITRGDYAGEDAVLEFTANVKFTQID